MTAKRATTVEQYIESAPDKAQPHLRKLRELFQRVAPATLEVIKWGNPFFIEPHDTIRHFLKICYEEALPEKLIRKIAKHRLNVVSARDE